MTINFEQIADAFRGIQDSICQGLAETSGTPFIKDNWSYEQGAGGGESRIFCNDGDAGKGKIEKGGVNFSSVSGKLNPKIAARMKTTENTHFSACGVSLVIHPLCPMAPTCHANIRHFEADGRWWFGGGLDLTPFYVFEEDAVHFHLTLKGVCDRFGAELYPKYKQECDEYFYLPHRGETRGVGGIFFDYLGSDKEKTFDFVQAVGRSFNEAYLPILKRRQSMPYGEQERNFQLYRRGRYVEFNLLYDRGTLFGLETKGRTESILMSLPPLVKWLYNYQPIPGTREAALTDYLRPIDWVGKAQ